MYIIITKVNSNKFQAAHNPVMHNDMDKAIIEAKRLADLHPFVEFVILKAVGGYVSKPVFVHEQVSY